MRACSWIPLGLVALACGGSAFTADENGSGGKDSQGGSDSGASSGGASSKAGSGSGGGNSGNAGRGGSSSSKGGGANLGGFISAGGDLGLGGDLIAGGSPPVAGTTSAAGTTSTAGSGPDPIDKTCPKTQPAAGGGCMTSLVCTYGTDARTSCRPIAKCENAKWALTKPECETLHACPAFQVGSKCDAQVDKACMLNATDGIYCVCTGCSGVGGPCSSETVWACAAGSGGAACPKLPPNKGQACAGEVQCGYGSCTTANSANASCDGATWDWDLVACPL